MGGHNKHLVARNIDLSIYIAHDLLFKKQLTAIAKVFTFGHLQCTSVDMFRDA